MIGAAINIFLIYSVEIAFELTTSKVLKEWIMLKSIYVKINFYYVKPFKWKSWIQFDIFCMKIFS